MPQDKGITMQDFVGAGLDTTLGKVNAIIIAIGSGFSAGWHLFRDDLLGFSPTAAQLLPIALLTLACLQIALTARKLWWRDKED